MSGRAPSCTFGFLRAVELWRVVVAVFFISMVVFVPVQFVVWTTIGDVVGALPDGGLPDGEIALIVLELLHPVAPSLVMAMLSGVLALWASTVLWHAGVVRWFVYSGRRGVRLAEILSRGLFGWWRWARHGLTAVAVLVSVHAAVAWAFGELNQRAAARADDWSLGIYLESGILLCLAASVLCWMASLRGAWLLGDVNRKSAFLAWVAGLWGTLKQPIRSLWTLTAWALPGLGFAVLPLAAAQTFEFVRLPIPGAVLGIVCGLLGAFCLVGLFCSFAPVANLVEKKSIVENEV